MAQQGEAFERTSRPAADDWKEAGDFRDLLHQFARALATVLVCLGVSLWLSGLAQATDRQWEVTWPVAAVLCACVGLAAMVTGAIVIRREARILRMTAGLRRAITRAYLRALDSAELNPSHTRGPSDA